MSKWLIGKEGNTYTFHDMTWVYEVVEGDKVIVERDVRGNPVDFDILYGDLVEFKQSGYIDNRHREGSVVITKI